MKEFVDTSVFVAAFWRGHPHHEPSIKLVGGANVRKSGCAAHTLAEVYATMTALPVKDPIPPEQALLFLDEIRERFTIVTLTSREYFATIRHIAALGLRSGSVYDALLLRCAIKVNAERIYTWNFRHFSAINPDLARQLTEP